MKQHKRLPTYIPSFHYNRSTIMELTQSQLLHVLKRFPEVELSYETVPHSKVSHEYQYGVAIPVGKKCYAWFTFHQNKDVCYMFEINREKKISRGKCISLPATVKPTLSLGTLIYGTIPDNISSSPCFIVEDIVYYQGIPLKKEVFGKKLEYLQLFMEEITTPLLQKPDFSFFLPVLWELQHPISDDPPCLPENIGYPLHHIQYRPKDKIMPYLNIYTSNTKKNMATKCAPKQETTMPLYYIEPPKHRPDFNKPQYKFRTVFQVKADLQFDIYHLFAFGRNNEPVYYNIAYIPNYKSSVFMNGLFRNIRENKNLDYIEESDDEDDFQNTNVDKYVNLEKKINMECMFHSKFKRWVPVKVVDRAERVIHIQKLVKGEFGFHRKLM